MSKYSSEDTKPTIGEKVLIISAKFAAYAIMLSACYVIIRLMMGFPV